MRPGMLREIVHIVCCRLVAIIDAMNTPLIVLLTPRWRNPHNGRTTPNPLRDCQHQVWFPKVLG